MKIVGIVCEYNPFHMGHRKQFSMEVLDISPTVMISVSVPNVMSWSSFRYLWMLGPSV